METYTKMWTCRLGTKSKCLDRDLLQPPLISGFPDIRGLLPLKLDKNASSRKGNPVHNASKTMAAKATETHGTMWGPFPLHTRADINDC